MYDMCMTDCHTRTSTRPQSFTGWMADRRIGKHASLKGTTTGPCHGVPYRSGCPMAGGKDVGLTADSRYGEGWPRRTKDSAIQAVGNSLLQSRIQDDRTQAFSQGTWSVRISDGARREGTSPSSGDSPAGTTAGGNASPRASGAALPASF